jgi:hypothetical protein
MWIKEQLEELELQKQNLKINWFCKIKPHTFIFNDKKIEIKSITNDNYILKIIVNIDGKDDDYKFANPPILVPDWTFYEEEFEWKIIKKSNFKEDLLESLHQIIWETYFLTIK